MHDVAARGRLAGRRCSLRWVYCRHRHHRRDAVYKLGQSLRKAIESYPEDLSVVVVATGGLSHQVHGERAGFNNPEWDMELLDLMENDPVTLTQLTIADYAHRGGWESAEVVMWLIMRGALSANVKKIHQSYYLPSMTALATAVYENQAGESLGRS